MGTYSDSQGQEYSPDAIAWDIETAPMPLSALTSRQRRRLKKEYTHQAKRSPEEGVTTLVRKAMSFHGFLCWICCISMAWRDEENEIKVASKTADKPVREKGGLEWVWRNVSRKIPGRSQMTWVTFNGKKFDARILRTRSLRNEVEITNPDVIDEYPYSYYPHCDVATLWGEDWTGLEDVADLFGISYESEIDGSEVAKAIVRGRPDLVEQHCEADAKTTLRIYEHVEKLNPEIR